MSMVNVETGIHGGDRYGAAAVSGRTQEEILDFSANINPLGMPKEIREAVVQSLSQAEYYPDPFCRGLREAIGEREGVAPEKVLCGNGGADLIYRLVYAVKPACALVTAPSFAEYTEALAQAGTQIRYWDLPDSMEVTEKLPEAVTEDLDLIFLCNPNNPTGLLTSRTLLLKILDRAREKKVRVCVDECFLDFVREWKTYTLKDFLDQYPNLILLKSFTKLYAMPGLRLGYVLSADRELLADMRRAGQPWAVSEPAQAAGIAALRQENFAERSAETVCVERKYLKEGLESLELQVYDGQANYLCFRAVGEDQLYEKLLGQGILIRRCANYRGLTREHYRVAVRTRQENEKLLEAMKAVTGGRS
jgi:threonine-phosphate decarboxylase